jgi:hypothetical protein
MSSERPPALRPRRPPAEWERLERLTVPCEPVPGFDPDQLGALPPEAQRYLRAAIEPGTPLAAGVRLAMRGSIKLGRWLPFRSRQLLVPSRGTVWVARVGGVITGSDRVVDDAGGMSWKLLGLVPVMHAEGPDVSRSTAERAAGESIWAPTAVAGAAAFTDAGPGRARLTVDVASHRVEVEHQLDEDGRLTGSSLRRWGDPDGTGTWSAHPFGVEVTGNRTFGGVTIPHRGRAGWHHGTDRWEDGVFVRYEITGYELLP